MDIDIDTSLLSTGNYDAANPLVLPSKRIKAPKVATKATKTKLLSKKQRKKLEKIVERREKKGQRADLLSELEKLQLPAEVYNNFSNLVTVQTSGVKKILAQNSRGYLPEFNNPKEPDGIPHPYKKIKGKGFLSKAQRNRLLVNSNRSVLGFDEESDSGLSSDAVEDVDIDIDFTETKLTTPPSVELIEVDQATDNGISNGVHDTLPEAEEVTGVSNKKKKTRKLQSDESTSPAKKSSKSGKKLSKIEKKLLKSKKKASQKLSSSEEIPEIKTEEEHTKLTPPEGNCVPIPAVSRKTTYVPVQREEEIEVSRKKLPILAEEQVIMEAIHDNNVVILAGETGSGKTTQIPQFLYEAGYTRDNRLIGVTEPRRVAAIAMSARVGIELNSPAIVSYQIRYEGNVGKKTQIKFMTDGVLLKEMQRDFILSRYSAIIIDEAHERSLNTDILVGSLSRAVRIRQRRGDPLKLIIMSATMRVEDFKENNHLFKEQPGFVHVPTRQFPVQIHFSKLTPEDYLGAARKKVMQIHRKLPAGGILVFVTGQQEVKDLVKELVKEIGVLEPDTGLIDYNLDNLEGEVVPDESQLTSRLHVVPLYSMLPIKEQKRVFTPPPDGSRLVVVATNVAETSLTIPSIRYVVDTGKVKVKKWDKLTGVQTFQVEWTSKASAEQRSGRAGRTGPGHTYRLFSSAVFSNDFPQYSEPEIKTRPVDDMVLLMKSMGIVNVTNFPYPTHPGQEQLKAGEGLLMMLGALETGKGKAPSTTITSLGETMVHFPVSPRFGKMIALSFTHSVAEYVVALVAALTVQEVLLDSPTTTDKEERKRWIQIRRKWAGSGSSLLLGDMIVLLRSVGAFEYEGGSADVCINLGLRYKAMTEIRQLRKQLTSDINLISGVEILLNPRMKPPTEAQADILRQIILSGGPDRVARLVTEEVPDEKKFKGAYWAGMLAEPTYIHQTSVLRTVQPHWLVYQEAFESNEKIYLRGITAIDPAWIPLVIPNQCKFGDPLETPAPFYDPNTGLLKCSVKATYGKQGWELPVTVIEYPASLNKYKLLAQCLLNGEIFQEMQTWKDKLLSLPTIMTKSWARLQPRTQTFLQAIASKCVEKRNDFVRIWEEYPTFLLQEYLEWIPAELQADVKASWPPTEFCE